MKSIKLAWWEWAFIYFVGAAVLAVPVLLVASIWFK